jgi:hypothetical protein
MAENLSGLLPDERKKESNKWDNYLIDKRSLVNQTIARLKGFKNLDNMNLY